METEGGSPQSIKEVRKWAEDKFEYIEDERERRSQIAWTVLISVEESQLTTGLAIDCLRAKEKFYREHTNRLMSEGRDFGIYYDVWDSTDDALKGAIGEGDVAKTIEFFRRDASQYSKMASDKSKILQKGGPFQSDFLLDMEVKRNQIEV